MWNAVWDDRPAEYAQERDCWLTRRRALFVEKFLESASSGQHVLELGSGVGDLLIALATARPDLRFVGIEPQRSYVEFSEQAAKDRGLRNLSFEISSAEQVDSLFSRHDELPWILSNDLLHHVADEARVLESVSRVANQDTRWLAIEPNWRNPYVFVGQAFKRGERNFRPARFLDQGRALGWFCEEQSFLFLIPPFVKSPPRSLVTLERKIERFPVLAGGIALRLARAEV
ncbi:MAG: methyltransferase domain-containing protein [Thermoanaerobaculia bacterium]